MQIYVHREGQQFGPYSVEQAKSYIASGNLLRTDLAWHDGATVWLPLEEVAGIAAERVIAPEPAWVPPRRDGSSAPAATSPQPHWHVTANGPTSGAPYTGPVAPQTTRGHSPGITSFTRQQRAIGIRNMAIGGLIFVIGMVVTVGTYMAAASSPSGRRYTLAWGAIIFGGYRFLRGAVTYSNA